jgi:dephospho-CoA kinase
MKFKHFQIKRSLIQEEVDLLETLIIINKGANYGQVVFLAGGAGSGKGFAVAKFMEGNKFKIRDVDEWKRLFMKMADEKDKYPEIKGLDLKNPEDVRKLHVFVDKLDVKDKTLKNLLSNVRPQILPNIIFDITAKDPKSIYNAANQLIESGYSPENINIVWVLTNFEVAAVANKKRERVVPDDILLDSHVGAGETMSNIIFKSLKKELIDGSVYVILNNREETKAYAPSANMRDIKPSEAETKAGIEKYNQMKMIIIKQKFVPGFTYIQVKKQGGPVSMDDKMKEKVQGWIDTNTPKRFYKPKLSTIQEIESSAGLLHTVEVGKGLTVYVHDSDPYDLITYVHNGDIIVSEYVSDYTLKVKEIKKDIDGFVSMIKNYIG